MAREFPLVKFRGLDLGACRSFLGHQSSIRHVLLAASAACYSPIVLYPIVPIQTRYPPENVRFEIADVTERLCFADASVDVVHARMACLSVRHFFSLPPHFPSQSDAGPFLGERCSRLPARSRAYPTPRRAIP